MYITESGTDIKWAKGLLEKGEIVAIPTETVYGLAANGLNESAVLKIYEVKNRPQFNPLILHVSDVQQMSKLVLDIPPVFEKMIACFCPGPITFLLPKSTVVPELVTAGSQYVAVRIPDHKLTLSLLSSLNFPLAAPSANISGYVSPVTANHVMGGLKGFIPYILDGGEAGVGLESTIVSLTGGIIQVHRLGAITIEQIQQVTGQRVELALSHEQPTAPGQLKSHYATSKPFLLGDIPELGSKCSGKKVGIISYQHSYGFLNPHHEIVLSADGDLSEAARKLFKAMRSMDEMDVEVIISERVPDQGIGRAINDRLERAAYKQ